VFPVNIRSKLDPPLPARFLGNGVFLGHATATAAELTHHSLAHIVKLVQDAKALVTDKYIRSAVDYLEVHRGKPKSVALLYVSSWIRIPMNVVDFGWGEPICMGPCSLMDEDAIFASCGDDMKSFEVFIALPSLQAVETFHRCLRTTISSSHSPA
jgi:omega-hydroxypalmitate O-feruloyl transferase